jgi:N-acetyl-gamma-glutamyl-phosphate reductase common form
LDPVPAIVLGGTGYVAGELLRLIAAHPRLRLAGVMSDGSPGESVATAFPHLSAVYAKEVFKSQAQIETLMRTLPRAALFCAAPHGVAAGLIDSVLGAAENTGARLHCVDTSADFRYASAAAYQAVYHHAHGAPQRLGAFTCALPEHLPKAPTPHIAHPGCFATAALLACVPLLALDLVEPQLFLSGITGSTGSGRKPVDGTHHPQRHSDLYAYSALAHRHTPEIIACAQAASGALAQVNFVPHSGPFARGIHLTLQARLKRPLDGAGARALLADFYRHAPFVRVLEAMPRVKDVATSNYAHLGVATTGETIAVMAAIDNLNKGAAGGALQWMNRLCGFPENTGLSTPAAGWT